MVLCPAIPFSTCIILKIIQVAKFFNELSNKRVDQKKSFQVFDNTMPTVKLQYSQLWFWFWKRNISELFDWLKRNLNKRTLIGAPFSECRKSEETWLNEKTNWIKYKFMQEESKNDQYKHYKKQKCVYETLMSKMVSRCGCFPGEFSVTGKYYREAKIRSLGKFLRNHSFRRKF